MSVQRSNQVPAMTPQQFGAGPGDQCRHNFLDKKCMVNVVCYMVQNCMAYRVLDSFSLSC